MEARIGSEGHGLYGVSGLDMQRAVGKRSLEWDLNDWKWDGDLFIARPLNLMPSGGISRQFIPIPVEVQATGNLPNSSSSYSDEANLGAEKEKWELEKKRKVVVIEDDDRNDGEVGSLSLKLGGQGYPIKGKEMANLEGDGGNKSKFVGGNKNRAVCQVEGCGVDLSNAKDYHKRHKVCEMHSKASKAVVGNRMQRFCQQCSRFHVLQEFDEGKRSCRRRLAGHNKRRRKTNPDAIANGTSLNHDQTSGYLLITLLRLLSNMHSNKSDAKVDELLLSDILKSLAGQRDETGERNMHELLQNSQNLLNNGALFGNPEVATLPSKGEGSSRALKEHLSVPKSGMAPEVAVEHNSDHMLVHSPPVLKHNVATNSLAYPEVRENAAGPVKMNNFDLNDIYIDSDGGTEDVNRCPAPACNYLDYPLWVRKNSQQSSPPQTSGNSDSASAQSPSSSSGNANSRTDRIIFKLFGKEPKDLPFVLRDQILDWLAHSPTDIESYIRPGCIVLTIFLHQSESAWEELCYNLGSSLRRLFDTLDDTFWRTGWVYIRVQNEIAFVCDGQVVVDTSLSLSSNNYCKILNIKPIAISASERVQFFVKGINLSSPTLRLLCAVEGNYLVQENSDELVDCVDNSEGQDEFQCVKFSCTVPNLTGRGFIEIEDPGFSNSFFPFIVAEEDVCSEICMLEDLLECTEADTFVELTGKTKAKNEAIDFIHEIGWLLHRSHLKSRLGHLDPNTELFPLRRFKGLIEFSLDREWCAVVKKLLNILLSGIVDTGEHSSANLALSEIGILHRAVRRNSRSLVDFLLRYVPEKLEPETGALVSGDDESFLFRPDVAGPAGLTPLHIAAGKDDSEDVLDALTNDPGLVGIEAWKSARDSTGSTPEDYARLRGHYSYIHLVQKKINRRLLAGHAVVDIPYSMSLSDDNATQKPSEGAAMSLEIEQKTYRAIQRTDCKLCSNEVHYGKGRRSLLYRPAMLSMVAIAAVCVCVALLFKSCPEVIYVFRPFRWELLDYGTS